ncbi:MAG: DUF4136 domain-containing protein [Sphingomonadales bacterium]|nr:DUF4136 domain-containing protein [Sphingomonadales bacterium]
MRTLPFVSALAVFAGLSGCVAPVGPVQVTRFHVPDTAALGKGAIAVEPGPGADGKSLEWQAYQVAVQRQLALIGYTEAAAGQGGQVAELRLSRSSYQPGRSVSPVNVGLGGSTGSYGSGVGLGVGINLSPRPAQMVQTDLSIMIKQRATNQTLWEGRASFEVSAKSPLADTALAAPKMAEALFKDFPGQSGQTIEVK